MSVEIIPAQPSNADDIAHMINVSFDDKADAYNIANIIKEGAHYPLLAVIENHVVGFIDGFLTTSIEGHIRTELDLLAVHPDYQHRGIGKNLITAFTNLIEFQSLKYIRALVRTDNTSMQLAISKCGYTIDKGVQTLYVLPKTPTKPISQGAHVIAVNTFTYGGVWLEGKIADETLKTLDFGQSRVGQITGSVVPKSDANTIGQLLKQGFEPVKDFHWWIYSRN